MVDLCKEAKPCLNQFINSGLPPFELLGLHLFSVVTFHRMELPSSYQPTTLLQLSTLHYHHTVALEPDKMHRHSSSSIYVQCTNWIESQPYRTEFLLSSYSPERFLPIHIRSILCVFGNRSYRCF